MAAEEQVLPLAPAAGRQTSDHGSPLPVAATRPSRARRIRCCACAAALTLLTAAVAVVVLALTVFRIKGPEIKLNGIAVSRLELVAGTAVPRPGTTVSLTADVSVKNPNAASFKYGNTTTALYYWGAEVGEARGPPGRAGARRTVRMNLTVEFMTDRLMVQAANLSREMREGVLTMSSYTRVGGRVRMLKIIRKHVTVKMNCTVSLNITTRAIQQQRCKRHVDF
ncbi:uncharacterized protein LOC131165808 [Malania oleifera]|uniref:uncharacterized protein LOC131165808 n=1 Tax=Malania oleifera TaxID=397392 RepID=UPI0025ADB9CC|nr:uncharacterized protein LOC131165808 [Malania oleifera]